MRLARGHKGRWPVLIVCYILLACFFCGVPGYTQTQKKADVETIAEEVCEGVGIVSKTFRGIKGAPILILEERHDSRTAQIQHAITLVRLHNRYALKHIALEGYLRDRPEINTEWYVTAAAGDSGARAEVAVRLLAEGEINSAEFMKLVYDDMFLHPVEKATEYMVELNEEASMAPILFLLKIAQESVREGHLPRIMEFQETIERLERQGNTELLQKTQKELFNYILSLDPWAQAEAKVLQDPDSVAGMSGEQHLTFVEDIVNQARKLSVEFEPDEKNAMSNYLSFWRGRISASKTMIRSTGVIADQRDVSIVAMTVGAAHTQGMCELLEADNRSFAVVTPLSLETSDETGNLTWDMLQRKYKGLSVYSEGFTKILLNEFVSPSHKSFEGPEGFKKPVPVLSSSWLQAKAELYLFTDRIARYILSSAEPPSGGSPPYGLPANAFKGKWTFIDPRRISIVSDTKDGKGRAVLFSVILNPNDPDGGTEIWVKAGMSSAVVPAEERESVESMLKKALEEVKKEKKPNTKAEDDRGRVRISFRTVAGFAGSQQAANQIALGSI